MATNKSGGYPIFNTRFKPYWLSLSLTEGHFLSIGVTLECIFYGMNVSWSTLINEYVHTLSCFHSRPEEPPWYEFVMTFLLWEMFVNEPVIEQQMRPVLIGCCSGVISLLSCHHIRTFAIMLHFGQICGTNMGKLRWLCLGQVFHLELFFWTR